MIASRNPSYSWTLGVRLFFRWKPSKSNLEPKHQFLSSHEPSFGKSINGIWMIIQTHTQLLKFWQHRTIPLCNSIWTNPHSYSSILCSQARSQIENGKFFCGKTKSCVIFCVFLILFQNSQYLAQYESSFQELSRLSPWCVENS